MLKDKDVNPAGSVLESADEDPSSTLFGDSMVPKIE